MVWAIRNINLPRKHPWDFKDRLWQIAILQDPYPRLVEKKSAQVGLTTVNLIKILHYLNYHNATAMYTLPRRDDISDFTNLTLDPIISQSPHLSGIIANSDSVRLKEFRAHLLKEDGTSEDIVSNLNLMEASVEPRMIPVDILANDEIDRTANQDFLNQFIARLDDSPDPHHYQYSTPTVPDFGIDALYQGTTQNEWMVKCPACNLQQVLEWGEWDIWDKNFIPEPEPHYICQACKQSLPPESIVQGQWVPKFPGKDVVGYHVTHMMMPYSRPVKALWTEVSSNRITRKNFYNLKLGLAYTTATGEFSKQLFKEKSFVTHHRQEVLAVSGDAYFMGVDQADDIHVTIWRKRENRYLLVYAEKIAEKSSGDWWSKIILTARLFHVRMVACDALPNTHDARKIQEKLGKDRCVLCFYAEQEEPIKWDREEGKVHIERTENFDGLRTEIADGKWQLPGYFEEKDPTIDTVMTHFVNMKRDEVENAKGIVKGRWVKTGPDHFGHSTGYARVATLLKGGTSSRVTVLSGQEKLVSESVAPIDDHDREEFAEAKKKAELVWTGDDVEKG